MKKFVRFAGVALLALAIGGGCGDDDDPVAPVAPPVAPPPIVGTVSGTVSVEGSGLEGVSVSAASQSATTGSSGGYSFANVPAGTHSVQISGAPADVAFGSTATPVTIATSGQMATADFNGTYIRTSTITGSVTAGGEGVVATVTATGTGMLTSEEPKIGTSNADGDFELTGLRAGGYMVTISDYPEGTEFTVIARNVTVGVGLSATASFDALGEGGPTTGTGALSIIITGVTDDAEDDIISGRVTVTIDVERADYEKVALYVGGVEVDAELFGFGSAPAEEPALVAAQQGVEFELSFNSDKYDPDTGEVTYPNGPYEIVAGVTVQGSTEESTSNRKDVEFENSSFVVASVNGLGDGERNSRTGRVWYGGPDVSVEISALAVSYSSGAAVSSVTLLQFCEDDAATDSEAPFSFPVDCDGFQSEEDGTTPMFNVDGAEIDSKGGEVYLDFKAPDAPHFQPNPNNREDGWVNASVDFVGEQGSGSKKDGWLIYNDDSEDNNADDGVGEYTPRIRAAKAADKKVGGALAAPYLTQDVVLPALAALAGQFSEMDEYCVVVSAVDMLGNESKLPKATDACVTAEGYVVGSAGLLAGVDLQAPTIEFSPISPEENAATMRNFQVQLADEGSGIRDEDPLDVAVNLRNATNNEEDKEIEDVEFTVSRPLATTAGLPGDVGYYTFAATVSDKAGNSSDEATRTALHDNVAPMASTIVGEYNGETGKYSMVATVTDNLSIKEYWAEMRFSDGDLTLGDLVITENGRFLPREGGVEVDAYNARDLMQSTLAPSLMVHSFRALQSETTFQNLSSIQVFARDHAGVVSEGATSPVDPVDPDLGADDGFDLIADVIGSEVDVENSDRKVFQTFVVTAKEDGGTVEIEATASGTLFEKPTPEVPEDDDTDAIELVAGEEGRQGLRDNPISRVDFYAAVNMEDGSSGRDALKYIGSVPGASAGAEDVAVNGVTMRNYIYSMEMSAADFLAIVGGKGDYGEDNEMEGDIHALEGAIVAFAVSDNEGVALYAPPVALVVEK